LGEKCIDCEVEDVSKFFGLPLSKPRGRPKKTWRQLSPSFLQVVDKERQI